MKHCYVLLLLLFTIACGNKKKTSLAGDEQVTVEDLLEAYPELKLPFTVYDTSMRKIADTTTIGYSVFTQFVPDTVITNTFNKEKKIKIHPIGKSKANEKETYIITLLSTKNKTLVNLSVFDNNKFAASMPLLVSNNDKIIHSASIDSRYSVALNEEWMNDDVLQYNKTIYAYNNVGIFSTVLIETNVSPIASGGPIFNPIDTFPQNNKYSGDYTSGKNSILSLRDGTTPDEYKFFIHFVNDGEEVCGGDLRGEIKVGEKNNAVFVSSNDPCTVDFTFTTNRVKVKEQGTCGNHRGIKCFFDHTFTKKKKNKSEAKKK